MFPERQRWEDKEHFLIPVLVGTQMNVGTLQTRFLSLTLFTIFVVLTSPQLLHVLLVSLNFSQQWDIFESYLGCDHWNQWFLSCKCDTLAMDLHHGFMLLVTPPLIFLAVVCLLSIYLFSQTISSICNHFMPSSFLKCLQLLCSKVLSSNSENTLFIWVTNDLGFLSIQA